MKKFSVVYEWLARLVFHKNDSQDLILRKSYFLIANLIAIFFLSCNAILAYGLDQKKYAAYILVLLGCYVAQNILLIIIRKWPKWFVYSVFSFDVILIFYIIIHLGGFEYSAGLLMAAYFFLLTAQWMKDTRLLFLVGAIFVIGVLTTGILYPYLTPEISGWKNNLFFVINFGWIGLLLAAALYFTIVKSENAAKTRAEQLQELDLLKSKLYADIAHEFRAPLTSIKAKAEEIGKSLSVETRERTNGIIRNSEKILFLVNQMLNLSRLEEGGVPMHYSQSDLVVFVKMVVNSFQGYADSKKIGLQFQPLCQKLMMDIEAEKLEETLANLLSNAIKYTPEGGDVFVTLRKLIPDKQNPEQRVEISVRDTGIGVPEDQLDKIFLRFYRVDDKRYPYQEGSGIGLTLVSEYLKLMQGSIHVSSSPDEGSEFVVILPLIRNAPVEEVLSVKGTYTRMEAGSFSKTYSQVNGENHPRLLIIEDNKEMTEYLIGLLGAEYQILTAENGNQGIEQAVDHIPDIILSDVMMPGRDGYQLCRELKNDFRTNHIPIVLLTARADASSRIIGLEQGADAYLSKPFDKKELVILLQSLFVQRDKLRLKFQSNLYEIHAKGHGEGLSIEFLNKTLKVLEKNYSNENFTVENLYKSLGISRVQLHRKLIALTGQPASNFIRNFRLHKARELLLKTGKNISEIAYEVGFSDPNYFTRSFSQEHGISPSELRKSLELT